MGVGTGNRSSRVERAYYPSGPRLDGKSSSWDSSSSTATTSKPDTTGNPDPNNYQLVRAEEHAGYLIVMIKYPDCTNYEGNKILIFRDLTLIQLVNQRLIDPHFFPDDKKHKSPVARFVPTEEGWNMAVMLAKMMGTDESKKLLRGSARGKFP